MMHYKAEHATLVRISTSVHVLATNHAPYAVLQGQSEEANSTSHCDNIAPVKLTYKWHKMMRNFLLVITLPVSHNQVEEKSCVAAYTHTFASVQYSFVKCRRCAAVTG